MTWAVIKKNLNDEPTIQCRGIGCPVSWKCWRWSDLERFKGKLQTQITVIQGYEECQGVHFANDDKRITFEGLRNAAVSSSNT